MIIRVCTALLAAALSISLFTGCAAGQPLDTARRSIENRMDFAENTAAASAPAAAGTPAVPAARLSKEEAIAIALKDAGLKQSEVTQLRTELDYDNGRAEYEVDFRHDHWEYDYEIDGETGKILSSDKDWED